MREKEEKRREWRERERGIEKKRDSKDRERRERDGEDRGGREKEKRVFIFGLQNRWQREFCLAWTWFVTFVCVWFLVYSFLSQLCFFITGVCAWECVYVCVFGCMWEWVCVFSRVLQVRKEK